MESGQRNKPPSNAKAAALEGIRVLDMATFVAAPFCGTILGDLGAEVIKIEQPGTGDALRKFGTPTECGDTLVWLSESRNKKTVTLDLRKPEGAEMLCQLVKQSDVLLENFRPGTLEKWGLGYEKLAAINPRLIMLRVSAYGQTGPKNQEPGFARIAHAFSGLSFLAGETDGPPVVPGSTSLADYTSGMWGAIGVMAALRHCERTGEGQFIDIGLYESIFRLLDEMAPAYARFGTVRTRMGADTINVVPHSHYQTGTGEWVALACTSDKIFERFAVLIGEPELAQRYPASTDRVKHRTEVNQIVANWVNKHSLADVLEKTRQGEVPCGQIYSIADIFNDPQYAARENLLKVHDERVGELVIPAAIPKMSKTPPAFKHTGRALGADNTSVYGDLLGLSQSDLTKLQQDGVI